MNNKTFSASNCSTTMTKTISTTSDNSSSSEQPLVAASKNTFYDKFSGGKDEPKPLKEKVFDFQKKELTHGLRFYYLLEERMQAYEAKYQVQWDLKVSNANMSGSGKLEFLSCQLYIPRKGDLYCIRTNKSGSHFCHAKVQCLIRTTYENEKAFWKVVILGCLRKCFHHPHFSITSFQTQTYLHSIEGPEGQNVAGEGVPPFAILRHELLE